MSEPDHLYFVACPPLPDGSRYVKIGRTINMDRRMSEIQTGCPLPLELVWFWPGGGPNERGVHERLKCLRERGEWFHIPEALLRWIQAWDVGGGPQIEVLCARDRAREAEQARSREEEEIRADLIQMAESYYDSGRWAGSGERVISTDSHGVVTHSPCGTWISPFYRALWRDVFDALKPAFPRLWLDMPGSNGPKPGTGFYRNIGVRPPEEPTPELRARLTSRGLVPEVRDRRWVCWVPPEPAHVPNPYDPPVGDETAYALVDHAYWFAHRYGLDAVALLDEVVSAHHERSEVRKAEDRARRDKYRAQGWRLSRFDVGGEHWDDIDKRGTDVYGEWGSITSRTDTKHFTLLDAGTSEECPMVLSYIRQMRRLGLAPELCETYARLRFVPNIPPDLAPDSDPFKSASDFSRDVLARAGIRYHSVEAIAKALGVHVGLVMDARFDGVPIRWRPAVRQLAQSSRMGTAMQRH